MISGSLLLRGGDIIINMPVVSAWLPLKEETGYRVGRGTAAAGSRSSSSSFCRSVPALIIRGWVGDWRGAGAGLTVQPLGD